MLHHRTAEVEELMASHKCKIGEIVTIRPALSRNVPGGVYEVTKQLPHNGLSSSIASRA